VCYGSGCLFDGSSGLRANGFMLRLLIEEMSYAP